MVVPLMVLVVAIVKVVVIATYYQFTDNFDSGNDRSDSVLGEALVDDGDGIGTGNYEKIVNNVYNVYIQHQVNIQHTINITTKTTINAPFPITFLLLPPPSYSYH